MPFSTVQSSWSWARVRRLKQLYIPLKSALHYFHITDHTSWLHFLLLSMNIRDASIGSYYSSRDSSLVFLKRSSFSSSNCIGKILIRLFWPCACRKEWSTSCKDDLFLSYKQQQIDNEYFFGQFTSIKCWKDSNKLQIESNWLAAVSLFGVSIY